VVHLPWTPTGWVPAPLGGGDPVALLFTDIEGSTAILERVGDRAWVEVLHRHYAMVGGLVALHAGTVVHVAGDGFMIVFADVYDAVGCAVAIQRRLAAPEQALGASLRVRMGVHTGLVIRDTSDLHGRTVVVAARIAARARGGEILVSGEVASCDPAPAGIRFRPVGTVVLKGLNRREILYSADWGARPARTRPRPADAPAHGSTRRGRSSARALERGLGAARAVTRASRAGGPRGPARRCRLSALGARRGANAVVTPAPHADGDHPGGPSRFDLGIDDARSNDA
jgi:class 3 adenylate cyclase